MHPGPELISDAKGKLTIFSSPEMVITRPNTTAEEGPYDTPTPLPAGSFAIVQGFGIHRAMNVGTKDAQVWSLRVLDATKPEYYLVALRPFAKQFVNLDSGNDAAVINVVPRYGSYDKRQEAFVSDIRNVIIPSIPGLDGAQAYVGGQTANFQDFHNKLYGRFPFIVAAVLILTFFVLMMFFQSVFLPLKAILMNLASILATYGVLVMIFQHGWGAGLFGFKPVGAVAVITPAILFVILFSLSTDYEVFMLSRIKEYYRQTGDNEEAVATGLQHTGRVVTAAGLILIGVFGSFATAGIITIKEIGLGLAIGVLIDTVIVRSIMVPATMRLAGNINWVMPEWLKRFVPELREGPRLEGPFDAPPHPAD
jgi:RND superfamily putative drug exporter